MAGKAGIILLLSMGLLAPLSAAHAYTFNVLHTFQGGSDGAEPETRLFVAKTGELYGTTKLGGSPCQYFGCGTIFKLAPSGRENVRYRFDRARHRNGLFPSSNLVQDDEGNFYGTTSAGGGLDCGRVGCGTVFEFFSGGGEIVLHSFSGADGSAPIGLVQDTARNLYGTSYYGGGGACSHRHTLGCGLVFKIASDGTETTLYAFQGGHDGEYPDAPVNKDDAGYLYGTTSAGGGGSACSGGLGCGTVFKVAPDGTETVLYAFSGGSDGAFPESRPAIDQAGNVYGTTEAGGANNEGVVFEVSPAGVETVLHSFGGANDGWGSPTARFLDTSGNLYGTTALGSGTGCGGQGCGIVFSLAPDGTETILYAFTGGADGLQPIGELSADKRGNIYGTAAYNAIYCSHCGIVFELTP